MAKPRSLKNKPEDYKKKPDTLLAILSAGGQLVLMVLGIIGIATEVFSENGLLSRLFTKVTQGDSFTWVMVIPIALVAIYIARQWFEKAFGKSSSSAIANLAMYVVMALGAFFLIRLLNTGSFSG